VRAEPRLCEFYPGICLTTEEKARINLSQGKNILSQVDKNLSQSAIYILPKHPHVTKPTHYKTHTNTHITKHTHIITNQYKITKTPTHYKTHTNTHITKHTHYKTHTNTVKRLVDYL
jgi:hypothetical protein